MFNKLRIDSEKYKYRQISFKFDDINLEASKMFMQEYLADLKNKIKKTKKIVWK